MKPIFWLEKYPHGWLLCAVNGLPIEAFSEATSLFPENCRVALSIPHHFRFGLGRRDAVMCLVENDESAANWHAEINASIAHLPPQERWWKGLDVGTSSASIFAVFCDTDWWTGDVKKYSGGSVPSDKDDLGRCVRLLDIFPAWRKRLPEVAAAYPGTKWSDIIARWPALEEAYGKGEKLDL